MEKEYRKYGCTAVCFLTAFIAWTVLVRFWNVRAIGPLGSSVGCAALNGFVHDLFGVHLSLYTLTDWLGLVPIAAVIGFAVLGLAQWIRRRSLWRVDRSILLLAIFYLIVMAVYMFFEVVVVNVRPVLIDGLSEASYPSSTTMLVLCVMPACAMQLRIRIRAGLQRRCILAMIYLFTVFMVTARLISGVHWVTDIIGGILISAGLVSGYRACILYHPMEDKPI